jgi:hypothetical protein
VTPYPVALERFPAVRQSRLATFDRCALSASFDEDFRHGWSGHPQARGTIFHRFAARALVQMSEQGEKTIPTDAAIEILEDCLRQADVDKVCVECGGDITERFMDGFPKTRCENGHVHSSEFVNLPMSEVKDLRWVVVKWANESAFDIENLIDVEQRIKADLTYDVDGDYVQRTLTGQLDAVFLGGDQMDEAIVLDWKDTWALPAPADVGFDGYFQQRFYAWLVFKNYPMIQRVTLREFYVRYSEAREATVWRSDIEDVERELAALVERFDRAFQDDVFPPSPGVHCQFCPRPAACPIFPGVRGEGTITDDKTARRFAAEATVAKAALDQRTKALKAYTSVHTGGVEVSDHKGKRVWGHRPIKRVSRPDKETMQQALRAAGAGQAVNLDELYREATGTRFEMHTPVEVEDSPDDAKLMSALEASLGGQS